MTPTGIARTLLARFDRYQRRQPPIAFVFAVAKKFSQDRGGALAGLIAYYGFLAVFPLMLVFVSILGLVLHGDPGLQAKVLSSAKQQFPSLSDYVQVGSVSGSTTALVIGTAAALWAGLGVTRGTQNAMNTIWSVPATDRANPVTSRLRGLVLLATLGTTVVVSTATSALRGVGGPFAAVFDLVGTIAPLILNLALFLVAFRILTTKRLTWSQVLPGAALGAVGWSALQELGGYYTRHVVAHASHLYGTFAVVIGLLAWIHLGAQVTLYAAEVNAVRVGRLWPRSLTGDDLTEADQLALGQPLV